MRIGFGTKGNLFLCISESNLSFGIGYLCPSMPNMLKAYMRAVLKKSLITHLKLVFVCPSIYLFIIIVIIISYFFCVKKQPAWR